MPRGPQNPPTIPTELIFEDPPRKDPLLESCLRLVEHPDRWAIVAYFDTTTGAANRARTVTKNLSDGKTEGWGDGSWEFIGTANDQGGSTLRAIYHPPDS